MERNNYNDSATDMLEGKLQSAGQGASFVYALVDRKSEHETIQHLTRVRAWWNESVFAMVWDIVLRA